MLVKTIKKNDLENFLKGLLAVNLNNSVQLPEIAKKMNLDDKKQGA